MSDNERKIEFDFRRKETEAGWISIIDRFALVATPTWFNWIGWVLALGALHFLHDQSRSILIGIMIAIAYWMLLIYFYAVFYKVEFKGIPLIKNVRITGLISIIHYGDSLLNPQLYVYATMARLARIVIPGVPHHVTQRGNRRGQTFFEDGDYALYLDLLADSIAKARVEVWAYCLMPNHVHIILVPQDEDGLRRTFADLHRRYTGFVNARARTTGHLWQGRFGSVALDDVHLVTAVRYVSLNPVRARLVDKAKDWTWSSVRAHLRGVDDRVLTVSPVLERVGDFAQFLGETIDEDAAYAALRRAETIGRPIGERAWLAAIEAQTGRSILPRKRGPKPKQDEA